MLASGAHTHAHTKTLPCDFISHQTHQADWLAQYSTAQTAVSKTHLGSGVLHAGPSNLNTSICPLPWLLLS